MHYAQKDVADNNFKIHMVLFPSCHLIFDLAKFRKGEKNLVTKAMFSKTDPSREKTVALILLNKGNTAFSDFFKPSV